MIKIKLTSRADHVNELPSLSAMLVSRCPKGDSVARGMLILLVGVEIWDAEEREHFVNQRGRSVGTLVEAKGTFTGDGPGKVGAKKRKSQRLPQRGEERIEERGTVILLLLPLSLSGGRCRRKGGALDLGTPQWGRSASRLCGCRSHAYYFTTLSPSAAATAPAYK
ncbi:hypothetical protein CDAR_315631 [Caerostris darwini]|uniref:Uncharacterized protein n=1 Tax=Caerostris darwini TaxID=1538125 RepID=A0AAV4TSB5_9ARAC|nr:hypothetical protein CDAR_315631 [Caerostris darwini]